MNRRKRQLAMYQAAEGKQQPEGPEGEENKISPEKPSEEESKGFVKGKASSPIMSGGASKAAKFLLLLSKDDAAKVLSHLKDEEIERLTGEIAGIERIDVREAEQLVKEFGYLTKTPTTYDGGPDAAREILDAAFGPEKAGEVMERILPGGGRDPFDFLDELEYHQIQTLLKNEPVSVVSSILPYVQSKKASLILQEMPPDLQMDVVKRIAKMEKLDPGVIQNVEGVLRERVRTMGKVVTQEVDGSSTLARILRHMNITTEERILESLAEIHPEVSDEVKEKLFTVETVLKIEDIDLQDILREFSDEELAVILKGKTAEVYAKLTNNISERRKMIIDDEMERLGPMRRADVDKASKEFLEYLRTLEERHRLVIHREDDYFVE